jgi:hypothetical protein
MTVNPRRAMVTSHQQFSDGPRLIEYSLRHGGCVSTVDDERSTAAASGLRGFAFRDAAGRP